MGCPQNGYVRINQYALVSYIPDPLGEFLDLLRIELAPECRPHAHVTVLPPRPLTGSIENAESELRRTSAHFHPFEVRLGEVKLFEASEVVYIEVARGDAELRQMHRELNHGAVEYQEPFDFHPHITLAQNLPHEKVAETLQKARDAWDNWERNRSFAVEELAFVQNTEQNVWIDLMHLRLDYQPVGIR